MNRKIEISPKSILITLGIALAAFIFVKIFDIVLGVFVAFILMTALNPLVNKLEEFHLPRLLSIWLVYLMFIVLFGSLLWLVIPSTISQVSDLISQLEFGNIADLLSDYGLNIHDLSFITPHINSLPKVFTLVSSAFSSILTAFTMLVITFYLLLERQNLEHHLKWFELSTSTKTKIIHFVTQVEKQIGAWVHGQLALMLLIGCLTYLGLQILGLPYALPLALIAGLLEILPNIGPTLAALPALIVGLSYGSPLLATLVLIFYILVQQLENTFIVPQIMRSAVGINPIVTILILLIGYRLGGIAGAVLAVPFYLVVKVAIIEFVRLKKKPAALTH